MNERVNPSVARPVISQRAAVTVRRVGVHLGAEVTGVDLRGRLSDAQFKAVEAALVEHEMIIFRDQDITSEQLMDLRAAVRRADRASVRAERGQGCTGADQVSATTRTTPPYGTDVWHSDETFRAEPPMATILRATTELPAVGGDTMFASMTAAYDGLSDRMQRFISGLYAIHDMKPFRPLFGQLPRNARSCSTSSPSTRPAPSGGAHPPGVRPQGTVRQSAVHIAVDAMDERESRALLDMLFHQALVPEYQFRHRWEPHTIAMWDNRSTQHYAVHDYYPQRRYMERVTIRGGPVTGVERADPASVRRAKYVAPQNVDVHGGHKPH